MRIAVVTPGFSKNETAGELPFLLELCQRLSQRHEVVVFALRYPHHASGYSLGNIRVIPLNGHNAGFVSRLRLWRRFLHRFSVENARKKFDIVHAFWLGESGFLGILAGQMRRVPRLVSACGGEFVSLPQHSYGGAQSIPASVLTGYALHCTDRITVGSQYMLDLMRRRYKTHMQKVQLIPFGVDIQRVHPASSAHANGRFHILNVGWLNPIKNQRLLLEAIAQARHEIPGIHLTIVGEGVLESDLRRLTSELQINSHVSFTGKLSWTEMRTAYASADLLVSTSLHEAQGMAVLEGAAAGLPVVATAVGSAPELGTDVLLVPTDDTDRLVQAITNLYRNPAERLRRGQAMASAARERFDLDTSVEAFEACYEAVSRRNRQ